MFKRKYTPNLEYAPITDDEDSTDPDDAAITAKLMAHIPRQRPDQGEIEEPPSKRKRTVAPVVPVNQPSGSGLAFQAPVMRPGTTDEQEKPGGLLEVGKKAINWFGKIFNRETEEDDEQVDSGGTEDQEYWNRRAEQERANWTELESPRGSLTGPVDSSASGNGADGPSSDVFHTPLSHSPFARLTQTEKSGLRGILSPSKIQGSSDKNVQFNKIPLIRVIPNKVDALRSWAHRDLPKEVCSSYRLPRLSTDSDTSENSSPLNVKPRQLNFSPPSKESPPMTPTGNSVTTPLMSPRSETANTLWNMALSPQTPRTSGVMPKSPRLPSVRVGMKVEEEAGSVLKELEQMGNMLDEGTTENARPWRYKPAGYVHPKNRPPPVMEAPPTRRPDIFVPRFAPRPAALPQPEKPVSFFQLTVPQPRHTLEELMGYCKHRDEANRLLITELRLQQQPSPVPDESEESEEDQMDYGHEQNESVPKEEEVSMPARPSETENIVVEDSEETDSESESEDDSSIIIEDEVAEKPQSVPEDIPVVEIVETIEIIEHVVSYEAMDEDETDKIEELSVHSEIAVEDIKGYFVVEEADTSTSEDSELNSSSSDDNDMTVINEEDEDTTDTGSVQSVESKHSHQPADETASVLMEDEPMAAMSQAPAPPTTPLGIRLKDVEEGTGFQFTSPIAVGEPIGAGVTLAEPSIFGEGSFAARLFFETPDRRILSQQSVSTQQDDDIAEDDANRTFDFETIEDVVPSSQPEVIPDSQPESSGPVISQSEIEDEPVRSEVEDEPGRSEIEDEPVSVASEAGSIATSEADSASQQSISETDQQSVSTGSQASTSRGQSVDTEVRYLTPVPEEKEEENVQESSSSSPKPVPLTRSASSSAAKARRPREQTFSLSQPVGRSKPASTRRRGAATVVEEDAPGPSVERHSRQAKTQAIERMATQTTRVKRGTSVESAGSTRGKGGRAAKE